LRVTRFGCLSAFENWRGKTHEDCYGIFLDSAVDTDIEWVVSIRSK
jgi:hypothetical protein